MDTKQEPVAIIHVEPVWDEEVCAWEIAMRGETRIMIYKWAYTTAIMTIEPGDDHWYTGRWCYASAEGAVRAAITWLREGTAEPEGWVKDQMTGRYRPGGDASREERY